VVDLVLPKEEAYPRSVQRAKKKSRSIVGLISSLSVQQGPYLFQGIRISSFEGTAADYEASRASR
jgi:hypothetical protein